MVKVEYQLPTGNQQVLRDIPLHTPFIRNGELYVKQAEGGSESCLCYNLTTFSNLDFQKKISVVVPVKITIKVEYV
jgi:hypothetical protein